MSIEPNPNGVRSATVQPTPSQVVRSFLEALAANDTETAVDLVASDIVYENVGLPTIRGRERFAKGARQFAARGIGFDVRIHRIAEEGSTVLTERTDALFFRGYRSQFWVCGTFEITDGQISLWRDYFDFWAIARSSLRGLIGVAVPSVRARFDDRV
ncbi:MAG: nuclear transport factor 2 family protein [Frankiaceae bacterium]|nr:nuclear transport factor 2 family protein [Frankiaceae bacterium]